VRSLHFLLCGVAIAGLSACHKPTEAAAESDRRPEAPAVAQTPGVVTLAPDAPELKQMTIEAVKAIPLPADEVTAPAKIEANPNRIGRALLPTAGRITRVMVKLGDAVVKGQPLVLIESSAASEAESAFTQSEASVRQAEVTSAKADADLARLSDLYSHSAVAEKEVLSAKTALALAASGVEQAKTSREQARRRLELLGLTPGRSDQAVTVAAPLSGKVLELSVVEGEFRTETSTPLVTIADLSRVWATSEVPESKIRYCKMGGQADLELIAYPNEKFRGHVTRIADTVNGETRTIKVSTELDNSAGRLRPEMFGQLRYADGLVPTPWAPAAAVVRVGQRDCVFVEQGTGKFVATPVEMGQPYNGGVALRSGVRAGDRIVTQGAVYLKGLL
jgi:cobalt-zinc-cadmium efflux system membrane fusion protein